MSSLYEGTCRNCGNRLVAKLDTGGEAERLLPPPHVLVIHQCTVPPIESWTTYKGAIDTGGGGV